MWDCLLSKYLHPHPVELSNSFFIGDAAGRPAGWKQGRRSDHASTDRKFALNIGLKFLTPEEFFLEEPSFAYAPEGFDPKKSVYLTEALSVHDILAHFGTTQEAILFVGSPASGKTTFYQRHLAPLEYVHINQDTLKTRAKCIAAMVEAIEAGQSVVIDNTHPSIEARDVFLRILSKKNVPTKCFWFQTDPDLALHLNVYRSLTKKTQRLPKLAFIAYKSRFQEPTLSEGFAEIVRIPLKPHFESSQEEKIFTMYLL
jgi:bifunctional polynucleotide phosphatase/kinase